MDDAALHAELQRVPAAEVREIDLGIPVGRVLKLRVGRLSSEAVEAADVLGRKSAGEERRRGKPGKAVQCFRALATEEGRELTAGKMRETQSGVQERGGRHA